jgi:MraZ protein
MFLGEYTHSLDDKGRLAIPARFRAELADGLYLTRGLDRCLVIWPPAAWKAMADRLNALSPWQADARRLQRLFFSGAVSAVPDKLGRIVIPEYLRNYAELQQDQDVVLVGVSDRVEIWSGPRWLAERGDAESNGVELAEQLARQGL